MSEFNVGDRVRINDVFGTGESYLPFVGATGVVETVGNMYHKIRLDQEVAGTTGIMVEDAEIDLADPPAQPDLTNAEWIYLQLVLGEAARLGFPPAVSICDKISAYRQGTN